MLDGNSYYFIRLDGADTFYAVSAAENPLAVILNVGDAVTISYAKGDGSILTGTSVTRSDGATTDFLPEASPEEEPQSAEVPPAEESAA